MTTATKFLKDLVSLEVAFVLLLFAGRLKADPRLAGLPDLTAVFLGLSLVGVLAFVFKNRGRLVVPRLAVMPLLAFASLVIWAAVSLLWSPSTYYGPTKVMLLIPFCIFAFFVTAVIIGPDPVRCRRFTNALVGFAILLILHSTLSPAIAYSNVSRVGGDYVSFSAVLCAMCVILMVRWQLSEKVFSVRSVLSCVIIIAGLALSFSSGARGPIVSLALSIVLVSFLVYIESLKRGSKDIRSYKVVAFVVLASIGFAAAPFFFDIESMASVQRFQTLFLDEGGGASTSQRVTSAALALELWIRTLAVGGGAGAFGFELGLGDVRSYPHNIYLELLSELGLVGFLLFMGATVPYMIRSVSSGVSQPDEAIAIALFFFALFSAQVSGDLTDNRLVFAFLGLGIGVISRKRIGVRRGSLVGTGRSLIVPRHLRRG